MFTVLSGAAISLQAYVNGRLGGQIGSAMIAAAINNLVAVVATLAIALARVPSPRERAAAGGGERPPRLALPRRARGRVAGVA